MPVKSFFKPVVTMLTIGVVLGSALFSQGARAEGTKELFMSATYGVLAGTLVGAASLAFTDKPGDNLKSIARGASIGLYCGILLGIYVIYAVPGEDNQKEPEGDVQPEEGPQGANPIIYPIITEKGIEGGAISLTALRF